MILPERKNTRIKAYDYALSGYYYLTICTNGRRNYFGEVLSAELPPVETAGFLGDPWGYSIEMPYTRLSEYGKAVFENIMYIHEKTANFDMDCFCIMPNHIHMIVIKRKSPKEQVLPAGKGIQSIPQLVSVFKRITNCQAGINLWQRNYYEHVIRNEHELTETRKYILENPFKWILDEYYETE